LSLSQNRYVNLCRIFYIFALFIFTTSVVAHAESQRDLIVQKEMNCIDQHLSSNSGVSWNDICNDNEDPTLERIRAVNQQLNQQEDKINAPKVTPSNVASHQNIAPQNVAPPGATQQELLAQEVPAASQKFSKKSDIVFEIGPEVSYIRYHEPASMKETGTMSGLIGIFTMRPPVGDYLNTGFTDVYRLEGRFSYGKVNYYGGILNSDGSVTPENYKGISDYLFEVRGLIGKDFNFLNQSLRLTPYIGGGYRLLYDSLEENKPYGYNRRIQYLYVPTGGEVMLKLLDGWSVGADAEYDFFARGFVTSYFQPFGAGDLNNTQKSGYGIRGSIKLVKTGERFNLIFEPFVRFWHIHSTSLAQSSVGSQGYVVIGEEPNNNSLELGGRLGVEF